MIRFAVPAAVALAASLSLAAPAGAATLVGLTADNKLVRIDTARLSATAPIAIESSEKVVGIDMRPADGKLYALTASGGLLVVDPVSGATTAVSRLSQTMPMGARPIVDFNPAADRLRVITANGDSLRINVDTGAVIVDKPLNFDAAGPHAGKKPAVIAGAYTNSMAGAKATDLLHVEPTGGWMIQAPPNDGVLKTRGSLGMTAPMGAAVDIATDAAGNNTVYMMADRSLWTVDATTGASKKVGGISGLRADLVDIAVIR